MTIHQQTISSAEVTAPSSSFLLTAMRVGWLRGRLICNELENVGVAFKSGLVDGLGAIELLHDAGLVDFIFTERSS